MTTQGWARKLTRAAEEALNADDAARVRVIENTPFIKHANAVAIERVLDAKFSGFPNRDGTGVLIVGASGQGKSTIAARWAEKYAADDNADGDYAIAPVIKVSLPESGDRRGLLVAILDELHAHYNKQGLVPSLRSEVYRLLHEVGTRVLIIDELQHALLANRDEAKRTLALIKLLGADLGITVVGCGIETVRTAVMKDVQLARRLKPYTLPLWSYSTEGLGLLNSLEACLPLRNPSFLRNEDTARWILSVSGGTMAEIVDLVRTAAIAAIETKRELIDLKLLKSLGWEKLSERTEAPVRVLA